MPGLREQIQSSLSGRVCFMGLGNVGRGDDGFGVRLAEALERAGVADVVIAGTNPERLIGRCAEAGFDHLVFLDAVDFGAEPGAVVFLNSLEISVRFSENFTHKIPLGLLAKYVESTAKARVWLLGAQPKSLQPAPALSPALQAAMAILAELIGSLACQGVEL